MGMPEIIINFRTLGTTAIGRSEKGIVSLILKDDTNTAFDSMEYKSSLDINSADWTAENLDIIKKTFIGNPKKVIVERLESLAADYNTALTRLEAKKWNYLAIPGIDSLDVTDIATWLKTQRDTNRKTYKAVLPSYAGDHEGIINFATEGIKVDNGGGVLDTYSASEYTARIAGILAGLPFTRSATYYVLPEVVSVTEESDKETAIDEGKLILFGDGEKVKIARGVNSLITTNTSKGEEFKKIKISEAMDMIKEDIKETFEDNYVGKVNNSYDNQVLFIGAINGYFKGLVKDEIVADETKAQIDINSKKIYLQSNGIDIDVLTNAQIKRYPTKSKVFVSASGSILDAMEDLEFNMTLG